VDGITVEDDIDACDGDGMLGTLMYHLIGWLNTSACPLTHYQAHNWIAASHEYWLGTRRPWGKRAKISDDTFKRVVTRGKKMGVLVTLQRPSSSEAGSRSCTSGRPTPTWNAGF
jgi:hypothetical protein